MPLLNFNFLHLAHFHEESFFFVVLCSARRGQSLISSSPDDHHHPLALLRGVQRLLWSVPSTTSRFMDTQWCVKTTLPRTTRRWQWQQQGRGVYDITTIIQRWQRHYRWERHGSATSSRITSQPPPIVIIITRTVGPERCGARIYAPPSSHKLLGYDEWEACLKRRGKTGIIDMIRH